VIERRRFLRKVRRDHPPPRGRRATRQEDDDEFDVIVCEVMTPASSSSTAAVHDVAAASLHGAGVGGTAATRASTLALLPPAGGAPPSTGRGADEALAADAGGSGVATKNASSSALPHGAGGAKSVLERTSATTSRRTQATLHGVDGQVSPTLCSDCRPGARCRECTRAHKRRNRARRRAAAATPAARKAPPQGMATRHVEGHWSCEACSGWNDDENQECQWCDGFATDSSRESDGNDGKIPDGPLECHAFCNLPAAWHSDGTPICRCRADEYGNPIHLGAMVDVYDEVLTSSGIELQDPEIRGKVLSCVFDYEKDDIMWKIRTSSGKDLVRPSYLIEVFDSPHAALARSGGFLSEVNAPLRKYLEMVPMQRFRGQAVPFS